MKLVKCLIHDVKYRLPTTEKEYLTGKLHDDVESCVKHHQENPSCKFIWGDEKN